MPNPQRTVMVAAVWAAILSLPSWARSHPKVSISDVFLLQQVDGGFGIYKTTRHDLYVRLVTGKVRLVGSADADGPPSGVQDIDGADELRWRNLALSADGRRVLFRGTTPKSSGLGPGIYRYTYGHGLELLVDEDDLESIHTRWERPVPPDLLPFVRKAEKPYGAQVVWAFRAGGDAFPLPLLEGSPLHWAAFEGRTADCVALIADGAAVDAPTYWGFTPLQLAISRGHEETALRLLAAGADARVGSPSAFHRAVALGQMQVLRAMLVDGTPVDWADELGRTPLHLAVVPGIVAGDCCFLNLASLRHEVSAALVGLLLEYGADARLRDRDGETPLERLDRALARAGTSHYQADWRQLLNEIRAVLVKPPKPL
jgi:hypothetical protein